TPRRQRLRPPRDRERGPPQRAPDRQAALAAPLPRRRRARRRRPRVLAHAAHRLLRGGDPLLEPTALALGLHAPRARVALPRPDAPARAAPRRRARLARRAGGRGAREL